MKGAEYLAAIRRETSAGKLEHPGSIIGVRVGDFYEIIGADAERVAEICGLTLSRTSGTPLVGLPYHALAKYERQIVAAGFTLATRAPS